MAYSSIRLFPTITTATDAGTALDVYLDGEVGQLYTNDNALKDGSAMDARGSYTTLGGRLDAMDTLIDAAGTGSNRLLYGTNAARLALSPVPNPCEWIETDTYTVWQYTLGGGWLKLANFLLTADPASDNEVTRKSYTDGFALGAGLFFGI